MNKPVNGTLSRLKRVLIAGLVSLGLSASLLGFSGPAFAADANDYYGNDRGSIQGTERYEQIQPEQDGMNGFDAVDPRRDTKAVEARSQELIDTAKRRKAQAEDPLEPAREAIGDLKDKIVGTTSDVADDAKDAIQGAGRSVKNAGREVAGDMTDDMTNNTFKSTSGNLDKSGRLPNQTNR